MKLGPNFDAPHCGFQVNWPILLILSRHRFFVATPVVSVMSQMLFFWSRHVFGETDVATSKCCRDLFSLELMSRPFDDIATLSLCI